MSTDCSKCGRRMYSKDERDQGTCSSCTVAAWSPEKRRAMGRLVALAFRDPKPTDAEKDAAIDEAFGHLGPPVA